MASRGKKKAKQCAVWFSVESDKPIQINARLTCGANTATSLFRLSDISNPKNPQLIGVTASQSDRAAFIAPIGHLPPESGRSSLVLDLLPAEPDGDKSDITLWIQATQNGKLCEAFDADDKELPSDPDKGVSVCMPAVGTPCHCGIFLFND